MTTRRVLLISYYFPPGNCIGSLRTGKLAKYLSEFGWEPWVLTVELRLSGMSEDLPIEVDQRHIIRAGFGRYFSAMALRRKLAREEVSPNNRGNSKEPSVRRWLWSKLSGVFSNVRFPDRALPWYLPALSKGKALMREQRFDAIISSHGPPASNVVASILSRRFRVPWVADFRDLWTQNHMLQNRGRVLQWLEERFEKRMMQPCHCMVTVSTPLKEQLEQLHRKPVVVIPNGFDEEDYREAGIMPRQDKTLSIVYTGMIYEAKQDPAVLFQALKELIIERQIARSHIRIEFYGANPRLVCALAAPYGLQDIISVSSRIPHSESIKKQMQADILLLLEWIDPKVRGFFSGKVFEYLGAKRPVLAVGPKGGVIEALLHTTRAGALVSTVAEAKATLKRWLDDRLKTGNVPYQADAAAVNRYTRRAQAEAFAGVLNSALQAASDRTQVCLQ